MNKVQDILDRYRYAEEIDYTLPTSGHTIRVAEAHLTRNPGYARAMADILSGRKQTDDGEDGDAEALDLSFEDQVDLFCKGCLRGWDLDIPIEAAREVFLHKDDDEDTRGEMFFREASLAARMPQAFANAAGKKKPSPKPGSRKSGSAKSRRSSATKRKPAASRSRKR